MATREKKAADEREGQGAKDAEPAAEETAAEVSDGETGTGSAGYEIPERPNRVLWGIGWGLGRASRAIRDGLVWIGDSVAGAFEGKPRADAEPPPADESGGALEGETASDESRAGDEGSEE